MSMPVENVNVKAVVAVLILGMFVSILNQTIINVALPPLMNEFNSINFNSTMVNYRFHACKWYFSTD